VSEDFTNPILVRKEKWLKVRLMLRERFGKLPDVNAVLMLIGLREVGKVKSQYEKEEKEELMHVGTCAALMQLNYYELTHRDEDGWPHYKLTRPLPNMNVRDQENMLIEGIVKYFEANDLM
jgi:hypothetical protein